MQMFSGVFYSHFGNGVAPVPGTFGSVLDDKDGTDAEVIGGEHLPLQH